MELWDWLIDILKYIEMKARVNDAKFQMGKF